ncbi:MAG TPA: type II toxin-antitoxin system VapC family toxin [Dehalococcoidia bacterium]|nr:type II toxin-antitoxin system VapC family toxin [Dehalococcoidia bacterium]
MLDSDCLIDFLKARPPAVSLLCRLYAQGDDLCVTDVVLAEVYSGLHEPDRSDAEEFMSRLEFLPTRPPTAVQAGIWRYQYARSGRQLGVADCLIAATAHAHSAVIVTGNVRDFPMPEVTLQQLPKS